MKKIIILSLSAMLMLFTACKKNETDIIAPPPAQSATARVKTWEIYYDGSLQVAYNFQYDNQARFIKYTRNDGFFTTNTYDADKVTQEYFNAAAVSIAKYEFHLNASGLADYVFNTAKPAIITYQTYNTNKNLIAEIVKNNGVVTLETYHIYDNAGNQIKDSLPQVYGYGSKIYQYYTDRISTIENYNSGYLYAGLSNKNSVKSYTIQKPNTPDVTYDFSLPELDAQGRVTKQSYTVNNKTTDYLYSYY